MLGRDGVGGRVDEAGDGPQEILDGDGLGQKSIESLAQIIIFIPVIGKGGHGDDGYVLQGLFVPDLLDHFETRRERKTDVQDN